MGGVMRGQSQVTLLTSDEEDPLAIKAEFYQTAELIKSKVEQYLQLQVSIRHQQALP
ncbi:hypothetical protein [Paenibacillus foliorum]|uniref:hypothetical protein n=1 Tax=Paenibacillus foliorum TaxID=2654974 RepID=UPI001FE4214C|nr:hypothetical protein [Paenibacillus foliorum]